MVRGRHFKTGQDDSINRETGMLQEKSATEIANRREAVASLRLRGAKLAEIQELLKEMGIVNHSRKGAAWSIGVISEDIAAARKQWLANAADDVKEHYSRVLAELQEVKKAGWARGDLVVVLRALSQECKIFGFNSPLKLDIRVGSDAMKTTDEALSALSTEKLAVLRDVFVEMTEAGVDPQVVFGQLMAP